MVCIFQKQRKEKVKQLWKKGRKKIITCRVAPFGVRRFKNGLLFQKLKEKKKDTLKKVTQWKKSKNIIKCRIASLGVGRFTNGLHFHSFFFSRNVNNKHLSCLMQNCTLPHFAQFQPWIRFFPFNDEWIAAWKQWWIHCWINSHQPRIKKYITLHPSLCLVSTVNKDF